jgi:site-specific DNA recombinase
VAIPNPLEREEDGMKGNTIQKRAALYVRVSSEEQVEGYSLPAQRRAIEDYCQSHGYVIVQRYADEGKSGRSDDLAKRPAFKQMLNDADAGRFDVLVVHKLDRFSRNLRVTLDTLERLERASVGFVSISENMDFTTPMGRVVLSTMGSLAQFYSDNLSLETKKGKAERKRQGLYNGFLPFGITKDTRGLPALDRAVRYCDVALRREIVPAEGLALAFRLAAGGQSDREIARALNDAGYRTSGNRGLNAWTKDSVRPMLQNRFYLGELPDGNGGWLPAKHGALIDLCLFTAAQTARERNTRRPRRVSEVRTPWALSGIGVCVCGASVVATGRPTARGSASRPRTLRCAGRTQGNGCEEPSFAEDVLNEQVATDILARFVVDDVAREHLVAAWLRHQRQVGDATQDRARVERRIARLKEVYLMGDMDPEEYQRRRAELLAEREALPVESATSEDVARRLTGFLADLPSAWAVATPEERNRLARQLFAEAVIENRTVVAVKPRPELLPFFVDLFIGGSDGGRSCVFHPARWAFPHSLPRPANWHLTRSSLAISA